VVSGYARDPGHRRCRREDVAQPGRLSVRPKGASSRR
jgi:hypothetical protein